MLLVRCWSAVGYRCGVPLRFGPYSGEIAGRLEIGPLSRGTPLGVELERCEPDTLSG